MLDYNEIRERKIIIFEGEPYEVISSHVFRKQQRKPVNATKLKNLMTGRVVEYSFHVSEKAEEADISKKPAKYIFQKKNEYCFTDPTNPKDRFFLSEEILGDIMKWVKENSEVSIKIFTDKEGEEKIVGVEVPNKVSLQVTEAPPNIKGDTATGGNKVVTLETGANINAPMFINVGDKVIVNTETGQYVERDNS
jgi:elongation factor P